ncbi:hypothetical protein [Pedobacter sp. SYSU D00535]|uniref:hypothetical protein n=1 Tax=Pedobacter sp. SYSU D00535 TaxID=2810308 RepID=UPI001A96300E|nr:hypothetical protein [Pedobacter sp. SYSU D00535]
MLKLKTIFPCLLLIGAISLQANGQGLMQRIKQKASDAAEKKVDDLLNGKKKEKESESSGSNQGNGNGTSGSGSGAFGSTGNSSGSGSPRNRGGAGLVTTPPDVKENLNAAESAFKSSSFGEARYALQQAMLGVEMEIGQDLLKSLPEAVSGLPKQTEKDQVTSNGWGWAGLTIHREYMKDDKQLSLTIANNSVMMSAINLFLTNGAYAQTTGGDQKWKQTKLKGHRAVIEFDESSGYKLTVPMGQSSLIVFEGINFSTEQEVMTAASQFDIDRIKKTLGEQ